MRAFRVPLMGLVVLALLFDVRELLGILQFGFPPNDLLGPAPAGAPGDGSGTTITIPVASTEVKVQFGLLLLVIGVVQAVLFRLTWKAWRR